MAVSLSVIAAKDSAGTAIAGGLQAQDKSGAGTGPFTLGQVLIDGVAGVNMAQVTAANAVKVDGSAVTQPVSLTSTTITGTVAATQSGTWTVQPGNTANTTAWKVQLYDGTTALPILAASTGAPAASAPAVAVSIRDVNANLPVISGGTAAAGTAGAPTVDLDVYSQYETVAASQSNQAMGATGAAGDYLAGVLVSPGTAGCGVVTVLDNATAVCSFPGGGTTALPSLVPFMIPVGLYSTSGAWKITTGANVTAVGIGKFT